MLCPCLAATPFSCDASLHGPPGCITKELGCPSIRHPHGQIQVAVPRPWGPPACPLPSVALPSRGVCLPLYLSGCTLADGGQNPQASPRGAFVVRPWKGPHVSMFPPSPSSTRALCLCRFGCLSTVPVSPALSCHLSRLPPAQSWPRPGLASRVAFRASVLKWKAAAWDCRVPSTPIWPSLPRPCPALAPAVFGGWGGFLHHMDPQTSLQESCTPA